MGEGRPPPVPAHKVKDPLLFSLSGGGASAGWGAPAPGTGVVTQKEAAGPQLGDTPPWSKEPTQGRETSENSLQSAFLLPRGLGDCCPKGSSRWCQSTWTAPPPPPRVSPPMCPSNGQERGVGGGPGACPGLALTPPPSISHLAWHGAHGNDKPLQKASMGPSTEGGSSKASSSTARQLRTDLSRHTLVFRGIGGPVRQERVTSASTPPPCACCLHMGARFAH